MSIKKIQFSPVKDKRTTVEIDNDESEAFSSNEHLTVKFQITETQIIAHSYKRVHTLEDMKRDIAGKFKVLDTWLDVLGQDGKLLTDARIKLNDLSRTQFGIVELQLKVNEKGEQEKATLDLNVYYRNFTLPEIITVNLGCADEDGDGEREERKVIVEIENRQIMKPFLGGYRDPRTKIEYHHACTQTGPMARPGRNLILSRETQTEPHLIKSLRTTRTPRNEIREFISSDEMVGRLDKLKRVRLIQRNFRAYKWRKLIRESAEQWRVIQEKAKERTNYDTTNADYNRVLRLLYMDPTAKEEFDQVYAAIKHWKREETMRLKDMHSDGAYIAELNLVLEKEIFLLNEVKQRRSIVKRAFEEKSSERLLTRLGKPKRFISSKKTVLEIDTLCSQRIRFWTDYYNDLKCAPEDKHKRLGLLEKVLTSLGEEEGKYNKLKDLQDLFEREINLWKINFTSSDMDKLRDRQLFLLFDFIQTIGKDKESTSSGNNNNQRICGKCRKLLPEDRFVLLGRKDIPDICHRCSAHQNSNYANVYREILRAIRRDERKCGALASFAFIIQAKDIQYIIETIWHGHSILSQTTDRHRLRLPRWMPSEDWSPWNCICLTETEAKTHLKLRDYSAIYQDHLLKLITSRNNLALTAFQRLRSINYEFVESGEWWNPLDKANASHAPPF